MSEEPHSGPRCEFQMETGSFCRNRVGTTGARCHLHAAAPWWGHRLEVLGKRHPTKLTLALFVAGSMLTLAVAVHSPSTAEPPKVAAREGVVKPNPAPVDRPNFYLDPLELSVLANAAPKDGVWRDSVVYTGTVRNLGSPTSMRGYYLNYILPNGTRVGPVPSINWDGIKSFGRTLGFGPDKSLYDNFSINASDSLEARSSHLIATGDQVSGRLLFEVNVPPKKADLLGGKYEICAVDVHDWRACSRVPLDLSLGSSPKPYPGLQPMAKLSM
jgi:hypothetical protein